MPHQPSFLVFACDEESSELQGCPHWRCQRGLAPFLRHRCVPMTRTHLCCASDCSELAFRWPQLCSIARDVEWENLGLFVAPSGLLPRWRLLEARVNGRPQMHNEPRLAEGSRGLGSFKPQQSAGMLGARLGCRSHYCLLVVSRICVAIRSR